jgi:hypothetical protein
LLLPARLADRDQSIDRAAHRVGADEQTPLDQSEGVDANLTIIETIVRYLAKAVFKHDCPEEERHAVLGKVRSLLVGVVLDVDNSIYGLAV